MTAADHLQAEIEAQNEKNKEKQKQMLNFIQPKTVSNPIKPSIEADIPINNNSTGETIKAGPNYVIHKINPNETLERICLIYNVSKQLIQRANDFTGDEIYMKKELIIPTSGNIIIFHKYLLISGGPIYRIEKNPEIDEQKRKRDLIELMSQHLRENSRTQQVEFRAEAQYYLEVTNYDFKLAIKEFDQDMKFEKEQELKFGTQKGSKKKGKKQPLIFTKK